MREAVYGISKENGGDEDQQQQYAVINELKEVLSFMHQWIHNKFRLHIWGWINPNINPRDWFVASINDIVYEDDTKENVK